MKKIVSKSPMDISGGFQRWTVVFDDKTTDIWSLNLSTGQWSTSDGTKVNLADYEKPADSSGTNPDPGNEPPPPPDGIAKGVFIGILTQLVGITNTAVAEELWNAYFNSEYYGIQMDYSLIPDLLIGTSATPLFNQEFGAFLSLKSDPNNKTGITTLGDFMKARAEYKSLFAYYGLEELATNANADRFISGNISLIEAKSRMDAAYDAINNADSILRSQLGSLNLSGQDLAKALLLGKDAAGELQDKIRTANILAAQVEAGFNSLIGAQELARQGITRERAREGLSVTKMQTPGYQGEAQRQGITTEGLQKELESENILGLASQRRRRIQKGGIARFSGKSGAVSESLAKRSAGSI